MKEKSSTNIQISQSAMIITFFYIKFAVYSYVSNCHFYFAWFVINIHHFIHCTTNFQLTPWCVLLHVVTPAQITISSYIKQIDIEVLDSIISMWWTMNLLLWVAEYVAMQTKTCQQLKKKAPAARKIPAGT